LTIKRATTRRRPSRASVSARLRALARPSGAFDASKYFRSDNNLRFYNAGTPQVRGLARAIHHDVRDGWSVKEALRFADSLMRDPYLETKAVGMEVLARYRDAFTTGLLVVFKRWLARNDAANWATTDAMCGLLIGPLLADHPEAIQRMRSWSTHPNMWVRRASAVALIVPMRVGLALDTAYKVADALRSNDHDLIQKAVGWMLREAGKRDSARLERHLRRHGARVPRTTLRYAIERFPPAKRQALLFGTRSGHRGFR
jgi:3-methyladenine DNA glycosylase AlkD